MNITSLKQIVRLSISSLKANTMDDIALSAIIRSAIVQVASDCEALPATLNFSAVADQAEYIISTVLPSYISMDGCGVWFNNGTLAAPNYVRLNATTKEALSNDKPNWVNLSSGDPEDYFIEANKIVFSPAPDAGMVNAFKVFCFRKPEAFTSDDQFSFEGVAQIPNLEILDSCIIAWLKWKLTPVVGKDELENPYEAAYYREVAQKKEAISKRYDVSDSAQMRQVRYR